MSDPGAKFDRVVTLDAAAIKPQVTWGTSPEMVDTIDGRVPDPARIEDPQRRKSVERALQYMGLQPNTPISEIRIDKVFIGSCTNSRIEDLRAAAEVVKGRRVAANVKLAMVVPGSGLVKRQAEAEGLDRVFNAAGFEWREPGCSMCLAMNDDRLEPGRALRLDLQPQLRRAPGRGRAHPSGEPGDGGGGGDRRPLRRRARDCEATAWKSSSAWKAWWRRSIAPTSTPTPSSPSSS